MINKENFSKACKEVLEILSNIRDEEYNKISNEFIVNLKNNADNSYISKIDFYKDFEKQELLPETIDLLAYIYRKFWCNKQEKAEFDNAMHENDMKYQEELSRKYNIGNLFAKKSKEKNISFENNKLPIKYKENFVKKIFTFIKNRIKIN